MKTIQEVEQWREGAELEFGDASVPVGQLFVRYVEGDRIPKRLTDYFDLFCFYENRELVIWLGPDLIVPVEITAGAAVTEDGEVRAFGVERFASGVWTMAPSLNMPGLIHAFVVLYDVPHTPPWERLIVLAS